MRCRIWIVALLVAWLPAEAFAACAGDPVPLPATGSAQASAGATVDGGTLILRPPLESRAWLLLPKPAGADIDLCTTVTPRIDVKARTSSAWLVFWRTEKDDYYALQVDSGGNASVGRWFHGDWTDIVKWRRAPSLKRGLHVGNDIRVTTSGDTAKLYLNGKLFRTVERNASDGKGYGLALAAYADTGIAEFDFTNIRSTTLAEAAPQAADQPQVQPQVQPKDQPTGMADTAVPPKKADVIPPLDAEGKRIYDLLLAVPPSPDNVSEAGLEFVGATGNLAPEQRFQHGSAEVTYTFKPPADGTESRISFFIYPDAATAYFYLRDGKGITPFRFDGPEGNSRHELYYPEDPFDHGYEQIFGVTVLKRLAWSRWAYQQGRVVIVGFTDQTLPPLKKTGVTTDKVSDTTKDRGNDLLLIGKFQLDAIDRMTIETKTAPAAAPALDAGGQRLYDLLLKTPLDPYKAEAAGTAFIDAKGNLSPKPAHGQAEVVYALKPPADGLETSLSYFIYPDAAAASRYLDYEDFATSIVSDLPDGSASRGTLDPFGPFDKSVPILGGALKGEKRAWIRAIYPVGRVVIVALTGEALPPGDKPYQPSDDAYRHAAKVLLIGKLQLDALQGALPQVETSEPATPVAPPAP